MPLITGIALTRARLVHPALAAALAVTGIVFPFTAILRVQAGAIALSAGMVVVFACLAYIFVTGRTTPPRIEADRLASR